MDAAKSRAIQKNCKYFHRSSNAIVLFSFCLLVLLLDMPCAWSSTASQLVCPVLTLSWLFPYTHELLGSPVHEASHERVRMGCGGANCESIVMKIRRANSWREININDAIRPVVVTHDLEYGISRVFHYPPEIRNL